MLACSLVAQAQTRQAKRDSLRALRDTLNVYFLNKQALLEDGLFTKEKSNDSTLRYFHIINPVTARYGMLFTDNLGRPPQPAYFEPDSLRGFTLRPSVAGFYPVSRRRTVVLQNLAALHDTGLFGRVPWAKKEQPHGRADPVPAAYATYFAHGAGRDRVQAHQLP